MILFPVLAAVLTVILTGFIRRHALDRALLDHPNPRSLHTAPTPRGGGIAVVATVLVYVVYALAAGIIDSRLGLALVGGGGAIAAIGTADDIWSLSPETRLAVHFGAAAWAVWWLGGLPSIGLGVVRAELGLAGALFAVILLVWMTNLYNFMDGIDGLATVEAISIAAAGGILLLAAGAVSLAGIAFVIAGASVGFLYWNWQPARIFMGDGCSGFLGFVFAVLAVASENSRALPLLAWFILASVFVMDASITIFRRFGRGKWREAHRTHAYQRAVLYGLSHSRVVLAVAAANLALAGLATIALVRPSLLVAAAIASVVLTGTLYLIVGRWQPFLLEPPST
jgi:Fuc2NAc and GlcNAc transferase